MLHVGGFCWARYDSVWVYEPSFAGQNEGPSRRSAPTLDGFVLLTFYGYDSSVEFNCIFKH